MISLAHQHEDERRKLREQCEAAQKALQDFVYVVSHDLGAPLRAVTGFAAILQNKYASNLDERGQTYLNFIAQGGGKAQQMLAGLLQYSRVHTQVNPSAEVDIAGVLEQVFVDLKEKINARAALIDCETMPTVFGDGDQIAQLLTLVIDNALTYQRPGIFPHIHIETKESGSFHKITVSDNGIGIAEEDSTRVFQIFKRLHADDIYPGIGMGLTIAQRIVERHGGTMSFAPTRLQGAACWFTLPKPGLQSVQREAGRGGAHA